MNKKRFLLFILIVIIIIVAIVIGINAHKDNDTSRKSVSGEIGTEVWVPNGEDLVISDNGTKLVLSIDSDSTLDKNVENYVYEIKYTLKVNDDTYSGSQTFGSDYEITSSDDRCEYKVDMLDFENNSVDVKITKKGN